MKKINFKKLIFSGLFIALFFSFFSIKHLQADDDERDLYGYDFNIRGLSLIESSGKYLSFNCLDMLSGYFTYTFNFPFGLNKCDIQYAVRLKPDFNLEGDAWSPAIGHVYFDTDKIPQNKLADLDYSFNTECKSECSQATNCIACYDEKTELVLGYGYIANTGSWLKMENDLGLQPSRINNFKSSDPGVFSGFASSNDFGRLSLNCRNNLNCAEDDYKVHIWKLQVREMTAPNLSFDQACKTGARSVTFKWSLLSGRQSKYRIRIENLNNPNDRFDSGFKNDFSSSIFQYTCPSEQCSFTPQYNASYKWSLELEDEFGESSGEIWFNTNSTGFVEGRLTDNQEANAHNSPSPSESFTTYKHEFPVPYFSWQPDTDPEVGVDTIFTSFSKYYSSASPSVSADCDDGACDYLWTAIPGDIAEIDNPSADSTNIVFQDKSSSAQIILKVTDRDGYYCSLSSGSLLINFQLPIWKEVKSGEDDD